MFRTNKHKKLYEKFPDWVRIEADKIHYAVSYDSPIYWILTERQKLKFIHPEIKPVDKYVLFVAKQVNYDTIDRDLAEYYHMREKQFRYDNERIRNENKKLVQKLADEDDELQRVKNELSCVHKELDLTKREKWKQLFESVLREIVIGKRYQKDIEQMRSAYEKEMENRRGFFARILGNNGNSSYNGS